MPEQLPIFPDEPTFLPIMPPHGSAAEQALYDLMDRDLTQVDWLRERKGWRLAAAVMDLKYLGWEPESVRVLYDGWSRKIALYSLHQKAKKAFFNMRNPGAANA